MVALEVEQSRRKIKYMFLGITFYKIEWLISIAKIGPCRRADSILQAFHQSQPLKTECGQFRGSLG
jgi:hypothetical protein